MLDICGIKYMTVFEFEKKVVLNATYGGYTLSAQAIAEILKRKGYLDISVDETCSEYPVSAKKDGRRHYFSPFYLEDQRDDEDLIAVIEQLGSELASGRGSHLIVDCASVTISIDNYDGKERLIVNT